MSFWERACAITVGSGGSGTVVDERFRVQFKVVKTLTTDTNTAKVEINGLSESTRQSFMKPEKVMQVEAGYKGDTEILSVSEITNATILRDPPEIITQIEVQDGAIALKDRKIALSFAPGTPAKRVVDKIASDLALPRKATGVQIKGVYQNGITLNTTARDALDRVTRKAKVTWSIQDRELQILDEVDASQGQGVLLTPETGLISSPERLDDPEKGDNIRRGAGWKVRSLLNPKIRPGEQILVQAAEVDGQFRIDTVTHVGDNRGNDWYSEAEVYAN